MPKKQNYSFNDFISLLDLATDVKTVSAIVVVATAAANEKKLSPYALAGVLRKASDIIYSISNHYGGLIL